MDTNLWLGAAAVSLALLLLAERLRPLPADSTPAAVEVPLVAAALALLPLLPLLSGVALPPAAVWLLDLDALWGVALVLLGLLALRRHRRRWLPVALALLVVAWPLHRTAGMAAWVLAPTTALALVALHAFAGRLTPRARLHLRGLAGSAAMAIGAYFLALVYVLGAGASSGDGVRLPPAGSAGAVALLLLALLLAGAAGYFFRISNGSYR